MRVIDCLAPNRFPDIFPLVKFPTFIFLIILACTATPIHGEPDAVRHAHEIYQSGLWDVAARAYRDAIDAESTPAESRADLAARLAECLIRDGKPVDALALLTEGQPAADSPTASFWRAQALAGTGRFAEAVAEFAAHSASANAPFRLEAALTSANLQASLDKSAAAVRTLASFAQSANPSDAAVADLHRAALLVDSGFPEEAREAFPATADQMGHWQSLASYTDARIHLVNGEAETAAALFATLLENRTGQSVSIHHGIHLGLADALAATNKPDAASRTILRFLQEYPDTPFLHAAFRRLQHWMPISPKTTDPILTKLVEWIPHPPTPATGIITVNDRASTAWPTINHIQEMGAFAMFTRAIGLHRAGTQAALHEARASLNRLRHHFPNHFLSRQALLIEGLWDIESSNPHRALDLFDLAASMARGESARGEARFAEALALVQSGNMEVAIARFKEAAELMDQEAADSARFNMHLAALDMPGENHPPVTLNSRLKSNLELERALNQADPDLAIAALNTFLINHPDHPRAQEAKLAAAERAMQTDPPDLSLARAHLDAININDANSSEKFRVDLVRLQIAEKSLPDVPAEFTIELAREILRDASGTSQATEASLILGRTLFHTGNYNEARITFEKLAMEQSERDPADPALVQVAYLLAARAAALGATSQSREEALNLFDQAIEIESATLRGMAVLEKARLLIDMVRLDQAIAYLTQTRNDIPPDDPLALPAGLLLGEAIYAKSASDPGLLANALAIYDDLLQDQNQLTDTLYNRLQYLRGITLEKLPQPDHPEFTRDTEAIEAYVSVILRAGNKPPAEWEWFERCAFAAMALLEKNQRWQAAINLARRTASFNGPRAADAAERAAQLQLTHMIWED